MYKVIQFNYNLLFYIISLYYEMKVKNGFKYNLNGWTYISIKGKPYERGLAHGLLLANEIKTCVKTMFFNLYDSYGFEKEFFILVSNFYFKQPIQENFPEFYDELRGITDGANKNEANITIDEVILWNNMASLGYVIPTIKNYIKYIPNLENKFGHLLTGLDKKGHEGGGKDKCSAFIAVGSYTEDGKICCAHNSFDDFINGQFYNVIISITPLKGNKIIYQSAPGYISSQTDFFVTSAGFIGTETTIGGFNMYEKHDPICVRIRNCMQYAKKLDDYVNMLVKNNSGDYANSWLIGDINNNEIMKIELGLKFVNIERKKEGYFIGYNAPDDPRIRNLECSNTGYDDIRRHQGARKVRLENLMDEYKGKINIQIAQKIISDHYDVYLHKVNPCSRTTCAHYELDDRAFMSQADRPLPYQPRGAVDGIVCNTILAKQMAFLARWGTSCGKGFNKDDFFNKHIQWKRFRDWIIDRPSQPWTFFNLNYRSIKLLNKRSSKQISNKQRKTKKR